jgi:hypothetical protein
MLKRTLALGWIALLISNEGWAASGLSLDSSAAYTTNANLVQTGEESDTILRIGGIWRAPLAKGNTRLSLRYADYLKRSENDLLSTDFGYAWKADAARNTPARTYELRFAARNYVRENVGTTDQGFTHYGLIGKATLVPDAKSAFWSYTPQIDFEYYPYASRSDFDLSFRIEYDSLSGETERGFSLSATPGLLYSTTRDFSKAYLALAADYEAPIDEKSAWGVGLGVMPSFYLSRVTSSTVLTTSRGRKGAVSTSSTVVTEKESTTWISPSAWYSRTLSTDWAARFEVFGNFQSSKSDTYNYSETQILASLRYRVF